MSFVMDGFLDELMKTSGPFNNPVLKQVASRALATPPKGGFAKGFKEGIPWGIAFNAIDTVTKPPHISLEDPETKAKRLAKDVAAVATGFGVWSMAEDALKQKSKPQKFTSIKNMPHGPPPSWQLKEAIKRAPGRIGRLGLGIAASMMVENALRKAMKYKQPKEVPL